MLVPRSYKYTSSVSVANNSKEKTRRRSTRESLPATADYNLSSPQQPSLQRIHTEPVTVPSRHGSHATSAERTFASARETMPDRRSNSEGRRKSSTHHDPDAIPPAVAALLAVTAIPPRKPNRYRVQPGRRQISIEELVQGWKSDESLKSNSQSSPLSILLEDLEDCDLDNSFKECSSSEPSYLNNRSISSDSMPSLESDSQSVLSTGSPSTPGSLRSRTSYTNLRKDKSRSLPVARDCAQNHPLVPLSESEDEVLSLPIEKKPVATRKPRSSFKSNLTTSLQSLKKAAAETISSLGLATNATLPPARGAAAPMDEMLWSHPFLFPRLSSETRPVTEGIPSQAERRYLNPMPLTFEEQEAPFQKALHAPFLAEIVEDAPTIQMQTYNRARRRGGGRRGVPNPNSEAGRAQAGPEGVRQREVRENPDFLRVVVLEMNMRREGKLEQVGRAKIWLPPRAVSPVSAPHRRVPQRWEGISAY